VQGTTVCKSEETLTKETHCAITAQLCSLCRPRYTIAMGVSLANSLVVTCALFGHACVCPCLTSFSPRTCIYSVAQAKSLCPLWFWIVPDALKLLGAYDCYMQSLVDEMDDLVPRLCTFPAMTGTFAMPRIPRVTFQVSLPAAGTQQIDLL
jgi:hypothetical protein